MQIQFKSIAKLQMMTDEILPGKMRIPSRRKKLWRRKESNIGIGLPPVKKVHNGGPKKHRPY